MRIVLLLGAVVIALAAIGGPTQAYDKLGGVIESDLSITTGGGGDIDFAVFGRGSDNGLWWRAKVGEGWTDWARIGEPEIMRYAPACITMDRRIHCAFVGTDNSVYLVYQPMTGAVEWEGPFNIGGKSKFSPTVDVSFASSDTPVFNVFVRGVDNQLYINSANQAGWTGWKPTVAIGGTPVCVGSTRDSTNPSDDERLCAWRDKDDRLFASARTNDTYSWVDTGGMSDGKPTITAQQGKWPYRMLVRGLDGMIWYNNYAGKWQGWKSAGVQTSASLVCLEQAGDTICASRRQDKSAEVVIYSNSSFSK